LHEGKQHSYLSGNIRLFVGSGIKWKVVSLLCVLENDVDVIMFGSFYCSDWERPWIDVMELLIKR